MRGIKERVYNYKKRPRFGPPNGSLPFPRFEISKNSPKWNFRFDPAPGVGSRLIERGLWRFPLAWRCGVRGGRECTSSLTGG